jgi:nitroimidazol reductase NimA-like FMN-containing flavoprotein (pyridoxamine 5'-phosphate oxidase superfamily)
MPKKIITEKESIELLNEALEGRLATSNHDKPYITPVNFVYHENRIFIHTGFKGKKLDNIKNNPEVCFEVSLPGHIIPDAKACKFAFEYKSVLIFGKANIIDDLNERLTALTKFMDKYGKGKNFDPLTLEEMEKVNVISIIIEKITGKEYKT